MVTPLNNILHKPMVYCNFIHYMVCYQNSQGKVKGEGI